MHFLLFHSSYLHFQLYGEPVYDRFETNKDILIYTIGIYLYSFCKIQLCFISYRQRIWPKYHYISTWAKFLTKTNSQPIYLSKLITKKRNVCKGFRALIFSSSYTHPSYFRFPCTKCFLLYILILTNTQRTLQKNASTDFIHSNWSCLNVYIHLHSEKMDVSW